MNPGRRAALGEFAQRVNEAAILLQTSSAGEVIAEVARLYGISPRQARRYVQAALQAQAPVPVPEAKVVFTVKVPASLPPRLRQRARDEDRTLSDLVTHALEVFLQHRDTGSRGSEPQG